MDSRWDAEVRDLKIDILSGEKRIEVKAEAAERFKAELKLIRENFPGDVITGSLALNLYGLIRRDIGDLDIIIPDGGRYSGYDTGHRYRLIPNGEMLMGKRLGQISFREKKNWLARVFGKKPRRWQVDFFEQAEAEHRTFVFEGHEYRIQNPLDIIIAKCGLESLGWLGNGKWAMLSQDEHESREKHCADLFYIFGIATTNKFAGWRAGQYYIYPDFY